MNPASLPGTRSPLSKRALALALGLPLALSLFAPVTSAQSAPDNRIASKSIVRVAPMQNFVFATAEDGRSFSWVDLFAPTALIQTFEWSWDGAAEGSVPWRTSMLLNANYPRLDTTLRVTRIASAVFNSAPSVSHSDSLLFKDTALVTANGAGLTAVTVRGDTALFGFGRLGLAYSRLGSETSGRLVTDDTVRFWGLRSNDSNLVPLTSCLWNRLCRSDTITVPAGGLDSVISVALDTTSPGQAWVMIATNRGLRRGAWRGTSFPYVSLPGIPDSTREPVRSVFTSPTQPRAWAFTNFLFFYSDDHGATFRASPDSNHTSFRPAQLTSYSTSLAPQVAFYGDTSYINFNMSSSVGLVRFYRDTLVAGLQGTEGLDPILLNANDSLDIGNTDDGSLTGVTIAYDGTASVLVTGTTIKGIFYRRLDLPGRAFTNLTRLAPLKTGLAEVITYPTLFEGPGTPNAPEFVRIGYRLKKSGKVTITIYNYAMEKVKVVVRNAPRQGGIARSENIGEDRWDGRDSGGRLVSVGTYYVHVESDQGEAAFGKIICARGRR